ncbi:hypothetical protein SAY87_023205 [Trapa incisa]|uniref:non-specific serine/threonine protein kinase n=1 Tax=Trapa incisa TaxID=236973 RepID=A0AAN7K5C5_9MYRT|nr:hypothetical protein SAY87_023205 [Trapa incisa]
MAVKKSLSWVCMVQGCYKPEEKKQAKKRAATAKQTSFTRISLSDLSFTSLSNLSSATTLTEELSVSLVGSNLYTFSLQELKVITQGFSSSNIIGEGGFGPVHKGFIDDKLRSGLKAQPVAVKLLDLDGLQGHREWLSEVIFLGKLRHPNLVKLIGYCCEDEHRLLVYEHMPRGSLENHLFRRYTASLPWSVRMKIAVGAAKGLAFIHGAEKPVIYRDFKSSNILLDSDYTAKLSDFGLARDGPEGDDTHVSTRVMGTQGYAAPEYIMTGHLTAMSDVYSFGVVLLELLTGRKSLDKNRPLREQNLAEWARPMLKDPLKLNRIMDPRLEGQYSEKGAWKAAALAYKCLSRRPKVRPTMSDVVDILEPLKDFADFMVGPFVYTASPYTEGNVKESVEMEGKDRHRHKHRPRSCRRHHHHHDKDNLISKSLISSDNPLVGQPNRRRSRPEPPLDERRRGA